MSYTADRRRAREEYYRENSAPGSSTEERQLGSDSTANYNHHVLSSSLTTSADHSVSSSHGPTVLSHVTEGTTETSSRHSGGSSARSGSGGGRSINTASNNDPPEISEDHYYRERDDGNNNSHNNIGSSYSDDDDDDEEELRTLATMDTNTFRRLREKRRKSKGSDTEGNSTSSRSSAIRHRSHQQQQQQQQQRSDPRGIHPRDRRVRYRGGSSTGHGRNSFDDDDHTDGGGSYHDSRSMMTDGISRSSRSTYRSNHRSRNNNNMNHPHSPSFTSQQWQMLLIFALGLVLVIKAGIVEVKLEKAQLRGGDRYSHLNHLSGDEYYKAPTVVNGRSLEDGEDEGDVGAGEDSPSETYFKDAVEKLESAGGRGGGDSQGEKEEKEGTEEDQQIEQDLEEGVDDEGEDIISNENNSAGEQQLQQQSSLEFLQSQSSMTQDVNLQQQQLIGQSQFQSQLVGKSPTAQQLLMADFQKFLQGRSDEQIQQPQQQNLFIQQQPQPNQQQQTQFGYQPNQFGQQQLPGQSQYHQQQGPYGQNQNQFGQQVVNQQNYLQYGQQPQQVLPQQFQQQQPQYYQQQQYNPQQNLQLPQQFEPQLQEDVQQQVFAVQSSNEVASPLGQIGNVGNGNLDAIGNEPASPLDYAPVGNVDVFNVAHADQNQAQSDAESQLSQQFDPQLQQDVQQQVFAVKSSNEVASPPDQFENVGDANLNANGNEPASPPDYAPVGNLNVIVDANADPTYAQPGAEIDQSPVVEDSPDPLPATDILNNRLVPFDVSLQRRFKGAFKKANDQVDADEDVEDVPIQVQPDAYGTLKESVQPVQEEPTAREPKPDPNNPDWNFKGAVVNDGVAFTNPRLWGAKTLTTPGLRSHLSKNDAKFAPAVV